MSLQSEQLKERTLSFAVSVLRLVDTLQQTSCAQVIGRQLAKCSTSVGANYRAACNARSRQEFIAKLCIVVEEADESIFWLDVLMRMAYLPRTTVVPLRDEATELRSVFSRSVGTARANLRARQGASRSKQINDPMTQ
jgi:four helix bundle protein